MGRGLKYYFAPFAAPANVLVRVGADGTRLRGLKPPPNDE